MAGIKDILEIEKKRSSLEDWRQVNLFQEGSFYRAYEASAWLCCCHLHEFKVTNRNMKGIEHPVTFVGFPLTSIEKWKPAEAQVTQVAEKQMLLTLPPSVWTDGTDVKMRKNKKDPRWLMLQTQRRLFLRAVGIR